MRPVGKHQQLWPIKQNYYFKNIYKLHLLSYYKYITIQAWVKFKMKRQNFIAFSVSKDTTY
jgi:hypothetical protein